MIERLTPREFQILELASTGQSDKQIASLLGIHFGTVSTYWNRMRTKLSASTRGEMIAKLVRHQVSPASDAEAPVELQVLEPVSDGLVRWGPDHQVMYLNEKARTFGLSSFASPVLADHLESVATKGEPLRITLDVGGQLLEVLSAPEQDSSGRVRSVFSIIREVSRVATSPVSSLA